MFSKKPDHSRRNSHSSTQEWFSKHRREEIVEKQEQMCPRADRPPALAVERNDGLGGTCHASATYANPGFIVAAVFSPRGVSNANSTRGMN